MANATVAIATPGTGAGQLPVGSVRVHDGVRRIKTKLDGPKNSRWMTYARWLWIQRHGQIPLGKAIVHMDGNTLNDDPSNLALGDFGDALWLWEDRNPQLVMDLHRRNSLHLIDAVRTRWTAFRMRHVLRSFWYPVDMSRRVIVNRPRKRMLQVLRDCGISIANEASQRHVAVALGWPNLTNSQAAMLHVLSGGSAMRGPELRSRSAELLTRYGVAKSIRHRDPMYRAIETMDPGFIVARRVGRRSVYAIGDCATAARGVVCPLIPIWGAELLSSEYSAFELEEPAYAQ